MSECKLRIWRGDKAGGEFVEYTTEVGEGMVVLAAELGLLLVRALDQGTTRPLYDVAGAAGNKTKQTNAV